MIVSCKPTPPQIILTITHVLFVWTKCHALIPVCPLQRRYDIVTPLKPHQNPPITLLNASPRTYKQLPKKSSKKVSLYEEVRTPSKLMFIISSAVFSYVCKSVVRQRFGVVVIAIIFANMVCNKLTEGQSEGNSDGDHDQSTLTNEVSVWEDEDRIRKALDKSKRSREWLDQSINHIEDTGRRIADENAQEEALKEARRKELSKQWVARTMRSQSQAIQEAQEIRRQEEENNLKAKKWAESMIRRTGADL